MDDLGVFSQAFLKLPAFPESQVSPGKQNALFSEGLGCVVKENTQLSQVPHGVPLLSLPLNLAFLLFPQERTVDWSDVLRGRQS